MTGGLQRTLEVDQDLRHPQFRGLVDNQKVPLVGPNGTVAVPKQRLYGAEQLVDVQVIRVAQLGLGLLLGLDVVCLVLQMPERANGGNYFDRAGAVAQLFYQADAVAQLFYRADAVAQLFYQADAVAQLFYQADAVAQLFYQADAVAQLFYQADAVAQLFYRADAVAQLFYQADAVAQLFYQADAVAQLFFRAGAVAQLLAQQALSRGRRPVQTCAVTSTPLVGLLKIGEHVNLSRSNSD